MKVISIVDDDYGIMFNNRRVSKDSVLNEHIIKMPCIFSWTGIFWM